MTEQRERNGLAYVCAHLDDLRRRLEGAGDATALRDLLAAVRDGQEAAGPLRALHNALLGAGDARGVYGATRSFRPAGIDGTATAETVYLCPADRCSRYAWPESSAAPLCEATGQRLRRGRL
ncbi:hypothetical protein [Streptomyces sp. NPDC048385]|uniref:hypothetical protein n=1 Tax=unclassified Streptomyces TaxID=2593676 RepID=UPI003427914B